jgi:hypothetical protein
VIFPCLFTECAMRHEDVNEEAPSRGSYRIMVLSTHGSIPRVYVRDGATECLSLGTLCAWHAVGLTSERHALFDSPSKRLLR